MAEVPSRAHRRQHRRLAGPAAAPARGATAREHDPLRPAGPGRDRSRVRCAVRSLRARRVPRSQRHPSVQGAGGRAGRDREPPGTRNGRGEPGALRPGSAAGLQHRPHGLSSRPGARGSAPRTRAAVCLVGAGGAGRAVGFALAALGADAIRLVDTERGPRAGARAIASVRLAGAGRVRGREPGGSGGRSAGAWSTALRSAWTATRGRRLPRALMRGAAMGVRRGLHAGAHAVPGRRGGGGPRTPERLRALLPPGSGRPRDLPR